MSVSGWSTRGWEGRWRPGTEVQNDWAVLRELEAKNRRCYIVEIVRNHVLGGGLDERTKEWYTTYSGVIEGDPDEKVVAAYNSIPVNQDEDGWVWTRSLSEDRYKPKYPSRHGSLVDVVESDVKTVARMLGAIQGHERGHDGD